MTRSNLDYEEYEFSQEELLQALYNKECIDEALEEYRDPSTYKSQLLFTDNNNILITIEYLNATESKKNNSETSNEIQLE
jgi:hypothetical protein